MSARTVARMLVWPATAAFVVWLTLRPLGPAADLFAWASFLAAQLLAIFVSQKRFDAAQRRLLDRRINRRTRRVRESH